MNADPMPCQDCIDRLVQMRRLAADITSTPRARDAYRRESASYLEHLTRDHAETGGAT